MTDSELLHAFAARRDETALAELVRRHIDLVYSAALRQAQGDTHFAEDVTQEVFAAFARKATGLARHPSLAGWFYTSARFAAINAIRREQRRTAREKEAHAMEVTTHPEPSPDWDEIRPLLDEAMDDLNERDRQPVLLRFFGQKSYATIGEQLGITENAAQRRVERALDRLGAALAKRGVTSTAAALGGALTHVGVSAPAALIDTATATALAGMAGATGASAAATTWLAFTGFMSTTKFTGGALALVATLAVSVAINAYLWAQPAGTTSSGPIVTLPSVSSPPAPLAQVEPPQLTENATQLRDRLRAAGLSENATRGVVEGILRQRYREELTQRRAEQMKHAWWRDSGWWYVNTRGTMPVGFIDDNPLLRERVIEPLEQLFGPDPAEMAEMHARYEFLSAEKRDALIALERDYAARLGRTPSGANYNPYNRLITDERDQKRAALLTTLSSTERAEYDLRYSSGSAGLRERMDELGGTETDYRTIVGLVAPAGIDPVRASQQEPPVEKLVAALGYDRALDYIWSGAREYPLIARHAAAAGLPPSTASRVLELAAETTQRAMAIHADATLEPAAKKAAVIALQQEIRPQLDTLLPPPVQAQLGGEAMEWLAVLGEGRYRSIHTSAAGTPGSVIVIGAPSVETPLAPGAFQRKQVVVPRPATP